MATHILTQSYSTDQSQFQPKSNPVEIAVPGHTFRYAVTQITERCFVLDALHTGARKQFNSEMALLTFLRGLRTHLEHKYSEEMADALREEAREAMMDRYYPYGQGL